MNIFLHKSLPLSVGGVLLGMISFFAVCHHLPLQS